MNRKLAFLVSVALVMISFSNSGIAQPPPGDFGPVMAFDQEMNRYLAVYSSSTDVFNTRIKGVFLGPDGVEGTPFDISSPNNDTTDHFGPSIAYDSINRRYMIVWFKGIQSGVEQPDIIGRLVNQDGTMYGDCFTIGETAGEQYYPQVAYDGTNRRFLVIYRDHSTGDAEVGGQLLDEEGVAIGGRINISCTAGFDSDGAVVHLGARDKYFVAWRDTGSNLNGKFVSKDGVLDGSIFRISTGETANYPLSIAYDEPDDRLLAVWTDTRNGGYQDIYGQIVDFDSFAESNFPIHETVDVYKDDPRVVYDSNNGRFLVAWLDERNYASPKIWNPKALNPMRIVAYDSFANYVTPAGEVEDSGFAIIEGEDVQSRIELAHNPNCSNFVASLTSQPLAGEDYSIDFQLIGNPCSNPPTAPELKYPEDGATGVETDVILKWGGSDDPDGDKVSYSVLLCDDENFAGCETVEVASLAKPEDGYAMAGLGGLSALFFAAVAFSFRKLRRREIATLLFLIITGYLLVISGCSGGGSYKAENLSAATKYYWKVIATDGKGGITHSDTWDFTTK